jgi:plastocyanin
MPNLLTVPVGTRVTWFNLDFHWYGLSSDDGLFFASLDAEGGSFSYTFTQTGTYWYTIDPYTNMYGSVVVV